MGNIDNKWTYRASLIEVVDGDTVDLRVDLGFKTYKKVRVRVESTDTAEIFGVDAQSTEFKKGMLHKEYTADYLHTESDEEFPLLLQTKGETGKYGRWIGDIQNPPKDSLTEHLHKKFPETVSEQ